MLVAFTIGIIVGYVLAIPPGPIGMAAIRSGLRNGWHASVKLAIGAGLFDVIYCIAAMAATSAVVIALQNVFESIPLSYIVLQVVIVLVMVSFGIVQFRQPPPNKSSDQTNEVSSDESSNIGQGALGRWTRSHGPFFVGVGFAIANLANPTFIPALAGMATFVQQLALFESALINHLAFSVGFGLGNTLWLFTLSRIVIHNKNRMTPLFVKRIQQVSGATLIGFGAVYGIRIIAVTKWTEVLRLLIT